LPAFGAIVAWHFVTVHGTRDALLLFLSA